MARVARAAIFAAALSMSASCPPTVVNPPDTPLRVSDAGGRPIEALEAGSSLHVGASGLAPGRVYEFRLAVGESEPGQAVEAVSFARMSADQRGEIEPFILWYHSGVVGCGDRVLRRKTPWRFQRFEEAERALSGQRLSVTLHEVELDPTGGVPPLQLAAGESVGRYVLPVAKRVSPMVYPSDAEGCLVNAQEVGKAPMYVSGRHFASDQQVRLFAVPNQRRWRVDDPISAVASATASADASGGFTVQMWDEDSQRVGAYDIVARRWQEADDLKRPRIHASDIVSYGMDTAYLLMLYYPPGGTSMDIAGRPLGSKPYFEFADSFATTDDTVWGAIDPTYIPAGHTGGDFAAYYVVSHRSAAEWSADNDLVDLSGGIEVMPVKSTCINTTDVPIWSTGQAVGDYDVVADFGVFPATEIEEFGEDGSWDSGLDFLDGGIQIGFQIAEDPWELGPDPVGELSYSADDWYASLGTANDVDLRAVVRYPAQSAGPNAPVKAGQHPVFFIQHGNHSHCEDFITDPPVWCSDLYTHAACPNRTPNHEGYNHLLDALASHGIIAVSIDAYDLTGYSCLGVSGWITERGDLILEHAKLWSHRNNSGSQPQFAALDWTGKPDFTGHVAINEMSVSGHSRGGEASVAAYLNNTLFTIGSVSSIAPTDFHGHTLPSVPYFVILPGADGDVDELSGLRIYDRAGSGTVPADDTLKSGIHVYGASHNFFNTVWADDGDDATVPRDDYIDADDQQKIGEAYLAAFARAHLTGEDEYVDMFRGRLTFPSTAGSKIYGMHHEPDHSRLESGSGAGATASGAALSPTDPPSIHDTQALQITWSSNADTVTWAVPTAAKDVSGFEVLSFRVAQTNSSPVSTGQNFRVTLADGPTDGVKSAYTYAQVFDDIPPPYDHPDFSIDHNVMTTVRIPLHSFIMNNSGVDLTDIASVEFKMTPYNSGEIYVDDIEFSR